MHVYAKAYSESSQTSKMELFEKIVLRGLVVHFFPHKLHLRCLTRLWMYLWFSIVNCVITNMIIICGFIIYCVFIVTNARLERIFARWLPECQGTLCLKQVRYPKIWWLQRDWTLQPLVRKERSTIWLRTKCLWLRVPLQLLYYLLFVNLLENYSQLYRNLLDDDFNASI